jgi:uncharacterized membrane protein YbhN (UPF0104 family)
MKGILSRRHLLLGGLSLVALAALCAGAPRLGSRLEDAGAAIRSAPPLWLWLAGCAFAAAHLAGALSWRAALCAGQGLVPRRLDMAARYCVGSGVGALTPAHLGSATRVALIARRADGGVWQVGGAAAAVGSVRGAWVAVVVAVAAALGPLPAWPVLLAVGALAGAAGAATLVPRLRLPAPVARLLAPFAALARSPRALARVALWAGAALLARLGAAVCVAAALDIGNPVVVALLVVAAVELAAVLPLTPGNVGVATAAIAFTLAAWGVEREASLAAGLAFGGIELLAALAVGAVGAIALAGARIRPPARIAVTAATALVVASAFGATVLLPVL